MVLDSLIDNSVVKVCVVVLFENPVQFSYVPAELNCFRLENNAVIIVINRVVELNHAVVRREHDRPVHDVALLLRQVLVLHGVQRMLSQHCVGFKRLCDI